MLANPTKQWELATSIVIALPAVVGQSWPLYRRQQLAIRRGQVEQRRHAVVDLRLVSRLRPSLTNPLCKWFCSTRRPFGEIRTEVLIHALLALRYPRQVTRVAAEFPR